LKQEPKGALTELNLADVV